MFVSILDKEILSVNNNQQPKRMHRVQERTEIRKQCRAKRKFYRDKCRKKKQTALEGREEKRTTTKCRKTQGKTINVLQNDTISGNFKFLRSNWIFLCFTIDCFDFLFLCYTICFCLRLTVLFLV